MFLHTLPPPTCLVLPRSAQIGAKILTLLVTISVTESALQMQSASQYPFPQYANPDEDWTKISDFEERRRIQSRIAQRKYRKRPLFNWVFEQNTT
ncbi:uncharacterized protein EI97DRAFT_435727 [Westerdykella ornata]|uniref:Uncharacterized protein n=1 Tax=Westerdykella ornata TaxID=318751 RepID=A0A6A6JBZ7_WESOR|nr:uncharacterized protein EI97DRAFT_435727 [Westerdykella ornata]KAF2273805.1 hypothetical protein EI97DRAFT_435727 [Westerdykella ornata]